MCRLDLDGGRPRDPNSAPRVVPRMLDENSVVVMPEMLLPVGGLM